MNAVRQRDVADTFARVVVAFLVLLIVVGLAIAVVLVIRDRRTRLSQPPGQSSVTRPVTSPAVTGTTVTSTPEASPAPEASATPAPAPAPVPPATDLDAAVAAVEPGFVDITIKRANGSMAAGAGIVVTPDGQVLTNDHVIEGALTITAVVGGPGGAGTFSGTVLGDDDAHDIALIQLRGASGLHVPVFGTTATVSPGEQVVALGHAAGAGAAPATIPGIVLALDQTIPPVDPDSKAKTLPGLLAIVAAVQLADTGGPVADPSGQVIGVNVAASVVMGPASVPVAYAIPINTALFSAEQIREGKTR
jgi:S1-C subfamily serine protease